MSRREVALNAALGLLLILVFAAPFMLIILVAQFLVHTIGPPIERYASRFGLPAGIFDVVLLSALCVLSALVDIRRRWWSNGALALAVIAPVILNWITKGSPTTVAWFIFVSLILIQRRLSRLELTWGALLVGVSMALGTGILGLTSAKLIQDLTILAIGVWFSLAFRRGDFTLQGSPPPNHP